MGEAIFLLLSCICVGLIYIVHKYFGKEQFYILSGIYSVIAMLMSFKIVRIFGVDINMSIIFSGGLLLILYYFINRYHQKEDNKLIQVIMVSTLTSELFLIITAIMIPSVYDVFSFDYQTIVFKNIPILIFYPASLFVTLLLGRYCFSELRLEKRRILLKTLFASVGLAFVEVCIFIYFSYAFLIHYSKSLGITIDNFLVKSFLLVLFIIVIERILKVKKVRE